MARDALLHAYYGRKKKRSREALGHRAVELLEELGQKDAASPFVRGATTRPPLLRARRTQSKSSLTRSSRARSPSGVPSAGRLEARLRAMSDLNWRLRVFGCIGGALGYFVGYSVVGFGGRLLGAFTGILLWIIIAGATYKGPD